MLTLNCARHKLYFRQVTIQDITNFKRDIVFGMDQTLQKITLEILAHRFALFFYDLTKIVDIFDQQQASID